MTKPAKVKYMTIVKGKGMKGVKRTQTTITMCWSKSLNRWLTIPA